MAIWNAAGAIGGAAINAISNIGARRSQRRENQRQREHDILTRNIQMGHDWDMWHANNKYNSPIEQMERLKEAGINPHLAYMQGSLSESSSLGNNSLSGSGEMGGVGPEVFSGVDPFEKYMKLRQFELQNKKTEAETENIEANTEATTGEEGRNKDLHSGNLEKQRAEIEDLKSKYKLTDAQIEEIKQKIEESKQRVLLMISQRSNVEQDTELKKEQEKLYKSQKEHYVALTHNVKFEQWAKTQYINLEKDRHEIAKLMFYLNYEMNRQGLKGMITDNMIKEENLKGTRIENQRKSNYTASSTFGQLWLDGSYSIFGNLGTFINTALGGFSGMVNTAYSKSLK